MIWCSDGAIVFEIQNLFHYRCIDVQNSREIFLFKQKENQKLKLKGDMLFHLLIASCLTFLTIVTNITSTVARTLHNLQNLGENVAHRLL